MHARLYCVAFWSVSALYTDTCNIRVITDQTSKSVSLVNCNSRRFWSSFVGVDSINIVVVIAAVSGAARYALSRYN